VKPKNNLFAGQPVYRAIVSAISTHKQAELALARSGRRFRNLLENIGAGVLIVDSDYFNIDYGNDGGVLSKS